ncbi:iron hydrogenase [Ascobolus immersus RN42]|uniref:Nuclear architecture-related protein 1 n=1 Tax=Ascobolus immersus RN42 TaxID=1160509 RepID=A0A3N4HXZ5_ASCIM|nr:iron hydrogenase [Ascobolus immersus RN42]
MSAILSADDLNDFIAPGVACIKPVETLPPPPENPENLYEVHQEDKPPAHLPPVPTKISLTDCLACSGCVTSAEALLVSLQSHDEVLDSLEKYKGEKKFVAMVSPQTRASLSAALGISPIEVQIMVENCLYEIGFDLVVDVDLGKTIALEYAFQEVKESLENKERKRPILTSACPGFICYAESTHPYLIPHLSKLKSPQALLGTLIKSILPKELGLSDPASIYTIAIMPCFDKKLEGSRGELTSNTWTTTSDPIRDVDCVITTRELLSLASSKSIEFSTLSRQRTHTPTITSPTLSHLSQIHSHSSPQSPLFDAPLDPLLSAEGTSDSYLFTILSRLQTLHPGSLVRTNPGRNLDTLEFILYDPSSPDKPLVKLARSYGFRNIQNLVRKLKPPKAPRALPRFGGKARAVAPRAPAKSAEGLDYAYVEVMACPGGCTNGGGQIKYDDEVIPAERRVENSKEWLARVDEAYFSRPNSPGGSPEEVETEVKKFVDGWAQSLGVEAEKLVLTTYREVDDEFAKQREREKSSTVRAAELAGKAGGGW